MTNSTESDFLPRSTVGQLSTAEATGANTLRSCAFTAVGASGQSALEPRNYDSLSQGDLNGDGRVDFKDLLILAQHFGRSMPPVAAAAQAPTLAATDLDILRRKPLQRAP
jgi:hypothetical protein